jgi:hypothetical protein
MIGYGIIVMARESKRTMEYVEFLNSLKDISKTLENIRNEYDFTQANRFNIFSSISDSYRKENFHSDILKNLLNPQTPDIGNPAYLDVFYNLLREVKKSKGEANAIPDIEFDDSVSVEREKGRIDIFIHDKKHGIIIENKINDAPDQDDQLAHYLEYAKKNDIEVAAVVYIPPVDFIKNPLLDDYSKRYQKDIVPEIKNKLVVLPVIDRTKNDIVHGFLDKIADPGASEIARVYIRQYSDLLKEMGERIMEMDEKKKLAKLILAQNHVKLTEDIVNTYNDTQIIGQIICEELNKKNGFTKYDDWTYHKQVGEIWMYFSFGGKKHTIQLWSDYGAKDRKKIKEVLGSDDFKEGLSEPKLGKKDANAWVFITHFKDGKLKSIKAMKDFVVNKFVLLEEKCKEIEKARNA